MRTVIQNVCMIGESLRTIKVCACMYADGYTAAGFSGRMPMAELADAVVQSGRSTLEWTIQYIQNHPDWRARVVYGIPPLQYLPAASKQYFYSCDYLFIFMLRRYGFSVRGVIGSQQRRGLPHRQRHRAGNHCEIARGCTTQVREGLLPLCVGHQEALRG